MPSLARIIHALTLFGHVVRNANAEGLWVANQARYECDNENDGSTARVVACVPSNLLGGKEYAIGDTWIGTEYRYLCTKTYPMQLALKKIGCVTPTGEELQPSNSSLIPDKGEYKCVTRGAKDKEVFLEYTAGCFRDGRLYKADESFTNGNTVLACKADGQSGYKIRAIACVLNDKAVPVGDCVQPSPGSYSKCQLQPDNVTAVLVAVTEKEYQEWLASSAQSTLPMPTTRTTVKTTTTLATIPTRKTTKVPRDCTDKHPLCRDLCAYPCFEDPSPRGYVPMVDGLGRPLPPGQYLDYFMNPGGYQFYAPPGWANVYPGYPWWQGGRPIPTTTKKPPKWPWGDDNGKPNRPPGGLCHIWTMLGKEAIEKMCPKSCQVIGCKYQYDTE